MRREHPIVVFSHLRWDFVYQRPQHLLSRLAKRRRVLFVEEPLDAGGAAPHWARRTPTAGVTVCRPHTPEPALAFEDPALAGLVAGLVADEAHRPAAAWLYTPMALPLVDALDVDAVVYDCMDELSAFLHAPPGLLRREAALLRRADLVFTGGPSLHRAKRDRHPAVHCFPSSVDVGHFAPARAALGTPPEQAAVPRPRLGFYGVIDERLDVRLVDALAAAHPGWQVVLVGPVVKIDPATLPRRANIHYLGQQPYAALPGFLSGWDVCLLPFALNEATRFISPTKTLEYMAAERPIVSTPIADVAEPYGHIVRLGGTPAEFVAACEQALAEEAAERAARVAGMRAVMSRTSWDATVAAMGALLDRVLATAAASRAA